MLNLFYKKPSLPNGRRYKRLRADFLVKYQRDGEGEARITNLRDLSAGGIRFCADENIPESSLLYLHIYLPPLERTVEAVAQVVRTRSGRGGLFYYVAARFLDLKQEDRESIHQFTEFLSTDEEISFLIDHAEVVARTP